MKIERTPYQEKMISLAHDIIGAYNTAEVTNRIYGFEAEINTGRTDSDGGIIWEEECDHPVSDRDNDVCDKDECYETKLAGLKLKYPDINISVCEHDNSCYNDTSIEHCCVCGTALSEFLHDISEEFPHQKEYSKTREEIISNAFEIQAVLYRMPESEEERFYINDTDKKYRKRISWTRNEFRSYAAFAKRVIDKLIPVSKTEFNALEKIGGLWTIKGQLVSDEIYNSRHLHIKRGEEVFWKEGFLFDDFHAASFELALAEKNNRLNKIREKELSEQKYARNLLAFYKFDDSLDAGNCEDGTLAFIDRAKLDKDYGYRGDFLLALAERVGSKHYVDKMIRAHG